MTTKRCSIPIKMILALMLVLPACSQEELLLTSSLGTAAEQGDAEAQSFLGAMYFLGQGVPQDYIQAYTWTSLAASTANELGIENIELITKVMTPEEIAAAQRLASEWKPNG